MRGIANRAGALAVVVALGVAGAADAKTYKVTTQADPKPGKCKKKDCSLREAVLASNASQDDDDKIVLPKAKTYALTHKGSGDNAKKGDLDLLDTVAIVHTGKGKAKIDAKNLGDRIFNPYNEDITLSKLVLMNGRSAPGEDGGAISAAGGSLLIKNSVFKSNETDGDGGAIRVNRGSLEIDRSTFANNRAGNDGGAITIFGVPTRPVLIGNSTFSRNQSGNTGGAAFLFYTEGASIGNSTFDGNRADHEGGAIRTYGATQTDLNGVTIIRNLSSPHDSRFYSGGALSLLGGSVELRNSMIALNTFWDQREANDVSSEEGSVTSRGSNLISGCGGCPWFDQPGDIFVPDPKVKRLANNGGPTKTVALKGGSAAIGAANPATALPKDQRGNTRDGSPDIGAFER